MVALILADGDVAAASELDARLARLGRRDRLVIAADGGARHAAALGVAIDRWVGDGDSIDEDGTGRARGGRRAARTVAAGQGRVRHRAGDPGGPPARRATSIVILGALGGPRIDHALANIGLLAMPELAGPPADDPRRPLADRRSSAPRARTARPSNARSRAGPATSSRCCRSGAASRASRRAAWPTRWSTSRCPPGRPAGCRTSASASDAAVAVRHGLPARRGVACYALAMSMPAVGDLAPEVALPDETGTIHRLSDQRGRWTILYFYPKDDTPGCTVEACEFRDRNETIHERGADVWGVSPQGAASKRAFREKFELPFTLLADEDHAVADAYGVVGREAELRQDLLGHRPHDVPDRPRRPDRPRLAEGQARGPCRRRPRGARRAPGGARVVIRRPTRGAPGGPMTEPRSRASPEPTTRWRPARFMVIAAHPDDAEFGPAGDRRALDRRRIRGLAGVLHERRPGRRGPRRRPARAGRPARDASSAPPPRSSATPGSRFLHQPDGALANDLALREQLVREIRTFRPDAVLATDPGDDLLHAAAGSTTPTTARPGIAAVDAVYPAARNPMAFPWLARGGLAAHSVRRLYLFWSDRSDTWVDISRDARAQDRGAARPREPDPRPRRPRATGSGHGPARRARRSGRPRPKASGS